MSLINQLLADIGPSLWVVKIVACMLVGFLMHMALYFLFQYVDKQIKPGRVLWPHALLQAIYKPFWVFLWSLIVFIIVHVLLEQWPQGGLISDVGIAEKAVFIFFFVWSLMRFINQYENNVYDAIEQKIVEYDQTTVRAISQLLRIILIVSSVLVLLQTLGIKISALLAVSGIGGIALSFAAKDNLANLLGGMMIFIDRPFSVGDWVRSPDRQIEGTVESIGWRLTLVRTFDKRPLYVPNGVFSTISIENPSRMTNRRIYTKIGLRYADAAKVASVLSAIKEMLMAHEDIDTKQTLMVNLVEFGDSSLVFFVYAFTKTTNWVEFQNVQQDVFIKILAIIDDFGAECAFPTTTVHVAEPITTITNHKG